MRKMAKKQKSELLFASLVILAAGRYLIKLQLNWVATIIVVASRWTRPRLFLLV